MSGMGGAFGRYVPYGPSHPDNRSVSIAKKYPNGNESFLT
ncbi:hypothetical protein DESC_880140 [Desulfosarcina cetonica]|nr:hypothetical protein DESC_880140 [Desulfosarcina cetonica]